MRLKGGNASRWSTLGLPGVLYKCWEMPAINGKSLINNSGWEIRFNTLIVIQLGCNTFTWRLLLSLSIVKWNLGIDSVLSLTQFPHSEILPSILFCLPRAFAKKIREVNFILLTKLKQISSKIRFIWRRFIMKDVWHGEVVFLFLVATNRSDIHFTWTILCRRNRVENVLC